MAADRLRRRLGLRPRVTVVSALTVGIALVVAGFLLAGLLRSRLDAAATTAATLRARDVAALAQAGSLPRTLALPGEESAFVQVVDASGAVIASTGNIDGEPAISTIKPSGSRPLVTSMVVAPLDQVDAMRVVALHTTTRAGNVTVYAGESLENAHDTSAAIITVLAVALPLLVLVVAGVTWWAVGRTLRPVRRITRTMADITASDLHRRVEVPGARDEIGQLALTVNETLARLDISVEQQRRFVADASHELRGPLAALRADLEISVAHPDRTSWHDVARDTLSDVERLQHLTEDLLLLARLDARQQRPHQPVDLAEIVKDATRAAQRDDLAMSVTGGDVPAMVDGDPEQLYRMVRNVVHNAEERADHRIAIALTKEDAIVRLQIADDGPGIPAEMRDAVFERFVRLDTARNRDSGGTGLGLAIVNDVIASHHGSIVVTDTKPHGATFTIELPEHRVGSI
ncbi:MAG: HAMP domain-containing sensor histidine kinase [Ilumatobacteraceae bacterium]